MIKMILIYHLIAYATAFAADMIIGDPVWLFHPATLIKNVISMVESRWNDGRDTLSNRIAGILFVLNVSFTTELIIVGIMIFFYLRVPVLAISVEAILTFFLFSARALRNETEKVYQELKKIHTKWAKGKKEKSLGAARERLKLLTGKDTDDMSYEELITLCISNTRSGITTKAVAPLVYAAAFGPIGGYFYKTAELMDDALDEDDEYYRVFGATARGLFKVLTFIPQLIAKGIVRISLIFLGKDMERITDGEYVAEVDDIYRAENLLIMSAIITFIFCMIILGGVVWYFYL